MLFVNSERGIRLISDRSLGKHMEYYHGLCDRDNPPTLHIPIKQSTIVRIIRIKCNDCNVENFLIY